MTPAQLRAFRAAYLYVCLNTGDGVILPEGGGFDPVGESTWSDPQWVRELCEEAGVLTPMALPGIWTPWAQVLCGPCHGISGPVTDLGPLSVSRRVRGGEPETEGDYGERICKCNECGAPIWVRSDIAKISIISDSINAGTEAKSSLAQTGGMCSAIEVRKKGSPHVVVVTAMDGDYFVAVYATEDAWAGGDHSTHVQFAWDEKPSTVEAGILDLLNNPHRGELRP